MFEGNPVTFPDPVATSCSVSGFKRAALRDLLYSNTSSLYLVRASSSVVQQLHRGKLRDPAVCTAGAWTQNQGETFHQSLKAGSDAADSALGDWMDSVMAGY